MDRKIFLVELAKTGNVFSACSRSKIPRSTVYRWKSTNKMFRKRFETFNKHGRDNMIDIAESVVINKVVTEKDLKAAQYYLNHNSPRYTPKKPERYDFEMADNLADAMLKTIREGRKKKEKKESSIIY